MSDVLTVPFGLVPWTNSRPTWKHNAPVAYDALREACAGVGEKVVLLCPATSNPHLDARVEVDTQGLRAILTVTGPVIEEQEEAGNQQIPHRSLLKEGFSELLRDYAVSFDQDALPRQLSITVESTHQGNQPDTRLQHALDVVMDLQYLGIKVLIDVFGVVDLPSFKAREIPLARQIVLDDTTV